METLKSLKFSSVIVFSQSQLLIIQLHILNKHHTSTECNHLKKKKTTGNKRSTLSLVILTRYSFNLFNKDTAK